MTNLNSLLVILVIMAAKAPAHGQNLSLAAGQKVFDTVMQSAGLDESKKIFVIKDTKKNRTHYLKYDAIKTDLQMVKSGIVGSIAIQIADSKFSIHDRIPGCDIYLRGRLSFQVHMGVAKNGKPNVQVPKERFNDKQLDIRTQNCGMMTWMVKGMVPTSLQESIQEAVEKVLKERKVAF